MPHVCPWWFTYSFDNPLRLLLQKPEPMLRDLVREGDHCLDLGCGFGYFTIPMARLAGEAGTVTAVDLQAQMLARVRKRAVRAGLLPRIRLHQADSSGIHFEAAFDFALAFWMLHEVPDQPLMLSQIRTALKPGGRLLLVEPRIHVSREALDRSVAEAEGAGFTRAADHRVSLSRAVLLEVPCRTS